MYFFGCYIYFTCIFYGLQKIIKKFKSSESYEEIDTRLASGWYVDSAGINKKKI